MPSSSPEPLFHVTLCDGRTTARFSRPVRLTEETAEAVSLAFDALGAGQLPPHLTVDLGAVEFLSSVTLGQLVGLQRRVVAEGGSLVLTKLRPDVRRVFTISRLDTVLDIEPVAEARNSGPP